MACFHCALTKAGNTRWLSRRDPYRACFGDLLIEMAREEKQGS